MGGGLIWFNLESGRLSEEVMFKLRLEETHQSVAKWKKKSSVLQTFLGQLIS